MTPARKRALQWFHDRGEVDAIELAHAPIKHGMVAAMVRDGHLQSKPSPDQWWDFHSLTDKGRRALHGDAQ